MVCMPACTACRIGTTLPVSNAKPGYWHPRHWISSATLLLLRALVLLPHPVLMWAGQQIGRLTGAISRYRNRVVRTNIGLCFPGLDQNQKDRLAKSVHASLGMGFMEMALCWWGNSSRLKSLATIDGLAQIDEALDKGRGVILLTGHFSPFEIAGRILTAARPLSITYRQFRNPVFNQAMSYTRLHHFHNAIDRSDTRRLVRALRNNEIIWYAPDQDPGQRHSIFAPFFGISASTLTTPARLARMTGATVLPFSVRRTRASRHYHLVIEPAWPDFPGKDELENASRFNRWLESRIRLAPEQYLWAHRRFKTRPDGQRSPYPVKPRRARQANTGLAR